MRPFKSKPANYAFIDSQNLNVGVQKFGWKMDWKKFRQFLKEKYHVGTAYMFIGYVPEFEDMYEQLHQAGFAVVLKPTYDMTKPRRENDERRTMNEEEKKHEIGNMKHGEKDKEEEKRPTKGNVDADLVLWAMKEMPHYSKAVIVSGDGDFYSLVEYLDEKKKLLKLLTPNAHYSGLFNRYEKYIERLDKFRNQLAYHDRKRAHKSKV